MKYEWRKRERKIYLPKNTPEFINIPAFQFLTIKGEGNPNSSSFSEYIGVLYSLSYAIKMTLKKRANIKDYNDYTVYPLEGLWDINEEAKKNFTGTINKDDLVFKLMIRQPHFVEEPFFQEMLALTKTKKPHPLLDSVVFETISEGACIQMLHIGSYDNETESFEQMEIFANEQGFDRPSKVHREIYLSDFRKTAPAKLKTVLRFQVGDK